MVFPGNVTMLYHLSLDESLTKVEYEVCYSTDCMSKTSKDRLRHPDSSRVVTYATYPSTFLTYLYTIAVCIQIYRRNTRKRMDVK